MVPAADRPADRDLADLYDAASAAATLIGDASRAVDLARKAIEVVDARRPAGRRSANGDAQGARTVRVRGLAGGRHGDVDPAARGGRRPAGRDAAVDDVRAGAGRPRREPDAGRTLRRVGPVRGTGHRERSDRSATRRIESRAMSILGVDRATLGNIAGGIELLRRSLALAHAGRRPDDDPARPYANLGSVLEMGGFVEEALEVSLDRRREHPRRYGSELSFLTFLEINAAAMLIELGRYAEAADLLERERVPRRCPASAPIHLHGHAGAPGRADAATWRPRAATSRSPEPRRAASRTRSSSSTCHAFGTEIALWDGDPGRGPGDRPARASSGWPRWTTRSSSASSRSPPCTPPPTSRCGRGPARRSAGAEVGRRRRARRDRPLPGLERSADRAGRTRRPRDRLADGALCAAELARAAGDDDPANWEAIRPALAARPAPFLEAYVLWRAAEALRRQGRDRRRGRRRCARATPIAAADRRAAAGGADRGPGPAPADRPRAARRRPDGVAEVEAGTRTPPAPGRPLRVDRPRTRGPRARRRGLHEPAHRRHAVHQREHGRRPRLAHPRQARRRVAHRGRGDRRPARAGSGRVSA